VRPLRTFPPLQIAGNVSTMLAGLASCLLVGGLTVTANADDHGALPTKQEIREARSEEAAGERNVAAVRADLATANAALEESSVAAAQAAEAYNGARYLADLARARADTARAVQAEAEADLERQRAAYASTVVSSYTASPELSVLSSLSQADGLTSMLEKVSTYDLAATALDVQYDDFEAAGERAAEAASVADTAAATATAAEESAHAASREAQAAADAAQARADDVAARKGELISELARLQGVSVPRARPDDVRPDER